MNKQNRRITDEELKVGIINTMSWDSRVDASDIMVKVDDGIVILTGRVPTYRSKIAALENIQTFSDVKSVENNISVEYLLTEPQTDEAETVRMAKQLLHWNSDLDTSNIHVEMNGGMLRIQGTVPYYWQLDRAEDLLSGLSFIHGINNELAVVPTRDISDQLIASEIVNALERSEFIDFNSIKVEVRHGHVTLSGEISTTFSNWHAVKTVSQTDGVRKVTNLMTIKYK